MADYQDDARLEHDEPLADAARIAQAATEMFAGTLASKLTVQVGDVVVVTVPDVNAINCQEFANKLHREIARLIDGEFIVIVVPSSGLTIDMLDEGWLRRCGWERIRP